MTNEILTGMAAVPLIMVLVQLVKGFIPDTRLVPFAAIILGVGYGLLCYFGEVAGVDESLNVTEVCIIGAMTGLSAVGLYGAVAPSIRGESGPPSTGIIDGLVNKIEG